MFVPSAHLKLNRNTQIPISLEMMGTTLHNKTLYLRQKA